MLSVTFASYVCWSVTQKVKKKLCSSSLTSQIVEFGNPDEFWGEVDNWQVLSGEEKSIVINRSKVASCFGSDLNDLKKEYEVAIRKLQRSFYEVRVWPSDEPFPQ